MITNWHALLAPMEPLTFHGRVDDWYARLTERLNDLSSLDAAIVSGRLAPTPGLAFLGGYQAALRALWPEAPTGIGAFCLTERRRDVTNWRTCFDGQTVTGEKDFVIAGEQSAWWMVLARDGTSNDARKTVMTVVTAHAAGSRLEPQTALSLVPEVPHARVILQRTPCRRLQGDGWTDYVKPFGLLEDVYVLAALMAWLYGVGRKEGWSLPLLCALTAILAGCREVARSPMDEAATEWLSIGLLESYRALIDKVDEAMNGTVEPWPSLWERDRSLLTLKEKSRAGRLDKLFERLKS